MLHDRPHYGCNGSARLEEARWCVPGGRWHMPGASPSEYETALASGAAVLVSHSTLMCALSHANLPHDDYAYGGTHWGKTFLLDVDGTLTEWTADDQADARPRTGKAARHLTP